MIAPAITLLTDFGTADGYVAEMKGVLLCAAPGVPLLDMSHDVPAHDVEFGRLTLARYWRRYPAGTVHLAVVDPGVGSSRAAIAVASDGQYLVGPDNGVLSPALFARDARAVVLPVNPNAAPTFHGRDVFAPAAAALACGATLDELGDPLLDPVRRRTPQPVRRGDGMIEGEVLTVDRFGNALTNILARDATVVVLNTRGAMQTLRVVRTYADAATGEAVALVGSSGFLEIAVRDGSAAASLAMGRGHRVAVAQDGR
ncbi:MAG TPA: SAM-dependent chlorinase/fluorinase [Gemmatimonas sp.]|nr:SAM-dependent chlorinase/fluorinase [Gemmatimonas sp.]